MQVSKINAPAIYDNEPTTATTAQPTPQVPPQTKSATSFGMAMPTALKDEFLSKTGQICKAKNGNTLLEKLYTIIQMPQTITINGGKLNVVNDGANAIAVSDAVKTCKKTTLSKLIDTMYSKIIAFDAKEGKRGEIELASEALTKAKTELNKALSTSTTPEFKPDFAALRADVKSAQKEYDKLVKESGKLESKYNKIGNKL